MEIGVIVLPTEAEFDGIGSSRIGVLENCRCVPLSDVTNVAQS